MIINSARVFLGISFFACSMAYAGDIYRCNLPGGRIEYQDAQCLNGEQTAVDRRNARREQFMKQKDEERRQTMKKMEASFQFKPGERINTVQ